MSQQQYFARVSSPGYTDKNKLHTELKAKLKSFNGVLITGGDDLEQFIRVLAEVWQECHAKHPRCAPITLQDSDKRFKASTELISQTRSLGAYHIGHVIIHQVNQVWGKEATNA